MTEGTVTVIDTEEGLGAIADRWRELAAGTGNAFVTPEWCLAALATTDRDLEPAVHAVWGRDGELRGVFPFVRARRGLRFCGARLADRFQPACEPADEAEVAAELAAVLLRRPRRQRVLRLDRVDSEATWLDRLSAGVSGALAGVSGPEEPLPYIPLAGLDWEGYLATRSRGLRSQIRRKTKALYRDHELLLRSTAAPAEAATDIKTVFRLHDARWSTRQGASSLSDATAREFHSRFAAEAAARGWLRLHLLETEAGEAVAGWYGWTLGGRCSYYQAGFDPGVAKHSPGLVLLAESIRLAAEEGAVEYDLLRGGEAFKSRLADVERRNRDVVLAPSGGRTHLGALGKAQLRRGWRRIPEPRRAQLSRLLSPGRW